MEYQINTPITLFFGVTTGFTATNANTFLIFYVGGARVTDPLLIPSYVVVDTEDTVEVTFTPNAIGLWTVLRILNTDGTPVPSHGTVLSSFSVVDRTVVSRLQTIEDGVLGSWSWDKISGTLTLLRQNGTTLASYKVIDTMTNASRELL